MRLQVVVLFRGNKEKGFKHFIVESSSFFKFKIRLKVVSNLLSFVLLNVIKAGLMINIFNI